jgi:hypothetical protein
MYSNTVIDTSDHADVKPVSGEQDGHTAQVPRFAHCPSYFSMRRRQLAYERGCSLDAAEEIILREATPKDGSATHRDGHIAQAPPPARRVPPTGMRLARILEGLRIHIRSVGCQIGPDALRDFVEEIICQDLHDQAYKEG